jgi:hypothetical protein
MAAGGTTIRLGTSALAPSRAPVLTFARAARRRGTRPRIRPRAHSPRDGRGGRSRNVRRPGIGHSAVVWMTPSMEREREIRDVAALPATGPSPRSLPRRHEGPAASRMGECPDLCGSTPMVTIGGANAAVVRCVYVLARSKINRLDLRLGPVSGTSCEQGGTYFDSGRLPLDVLQWVRLDSPHLQHRNGPDQGGRHFRHPHERPGALLVVSLPCAHPGNWLGLATGTVLPAAVASGITLALASGWRPSQPGPAFTLTVEEP